MSKRKMKFLLALKAGDYKTVDEIMKKNRSSFYRRKISKKDFIES